MQRDIISPEATHGSISGTIRWAKADFDATNFVGGLTPTGLFTVRASQVVETPGSSGPPPEFGSVVFHTATFTEQAGPISQSSDGANFLAPYTLQDVPALEPLLVTVDVSKDFGQFDVRYATPAGGPNPVQLEILQAVNGVDFRASGYVIH